MLSFCVLCLPFFSRSFPSPPLIVNNTLRINLFWDTTLLLEFWYAHLEILPAVGESTDEIPVIHAFLGPAYSRGPEPRITTKEADLQLSIKSRALRLPNRPAERLKEK